MTNPAARLIIIDYALLLLICKGSFVYRRMSTQRSIVQLFSTIIVGVTENSNFLQFFFFFANKLHTPLLHVSVLTLDVQLDSEALLDSASRSNVALVFLQRIIVVGGGQRVAAAAAAQINVAHGRRRVLNVQLLWASVPRVRLV